jgi:hypothetical protein
MTSKTTVGKEQGAFDWGSLFYFMISASFVVAIGPSVYSFLLFERE